MYRTEPLFPYMNSVEYMIMPSGLPERFYPEEAERKHITEHYVICFGKNVPEDIKERFIKDYADYYAKAKASGECYH